MHSDPERSFLNFFLHVEAEIRLAMKCCRIGPFVIRSSEDQNCRTWDGFIRLMFTVYSDCNAAWLESSRRRSVINFALSRPLLREEKRQCCNVVVISVYEFIAQRTQHGSCKNGTSCMLLSRTFGKQTRSIYILSIMPIS